ncbi:hypothetical protein RAB80_016436 [Fusarium oxysporum f. sp. vasinfectum]|nr:hypothetical protein RAB80_016436 [Fusarium oxysporum f. sp. vasinfectum]
MSPRVRPYHARQHSLTILQTAQPQDGGPLSNWVISENQCLAQSILYPLRNDPTSAVSPHQGYAELAVGGWRGTDPGSTASSITSGLGFAPFDHTTDHFPVAALRLRQTVEAFSVIVYGVSDWAKLATDLGNSTYTAADVHQLFYPKDSSNGDDLAALTSRPTGFFSSLDRKAYHDLFRHIIQHNPTLPFADVQSLLRIKKDEGEIMTRVIDHVVLWINARPIDIVNRHDNNKPLRRQDLMPAIERLMATICGADWWAQLRERGGGDGGTEDIAAWLELCSQSLEKQILDYVRLYMARFKDPSIMQYLALMPEEEHDHSYAECFATDDLWLGLFRVVQNTIGPAFRPTWQDSVSDRVGDLHGGDEAHNLDSETHRRPASAITRAICSQLGNIPEVIENPALCGVYASTELGTYIDQAVLT